MPTRILLSAVTFGWLSLFGLGAAFGEAGEAMWLYLALGVAFGVVVAVATRETHLPRSTAWTSARVCFALAVLLLVWGFLGLLLGHDPVTGAGYESRGGALPGTIALLSAAPALAGLLLLAMRER